MKANNVFTELLLSSKMQTPRHFFTSKPADADPWLYYPIYNGRHLNLNSNILDSWLKCGVCEV